MKIQILCAATVALLSAGCALTKAPAEKMGAVFHERTEASEAEKGVIILLPGFGNSASDFERYGFIDAFREAGITDEIIAAEAHFGYYREGSVVDRVYEDLLKPAVDAGATRIWLVGVSMGGSGALGVAEAYPELIDGVWLFAPYLGPREYIAEIQAAGGLASWEPGEPASDESERDAYFRNIWIFLSGYAHGEARPELRIGTGEADRLLEPSRIAAAVLSPDSLVTIPGGHGWAVWTPLLKLQLEAGSTAGSAVLE